MRIAVLGSWREGDGHYRVRQTKKEFVVACNEIGAELARRQQIVIVGGQSDGTADAHVVRGYINVAGDGQSDH